MPPDICPNCGNVASPGIVTCPKCGRLVALPSSRPIESKTADLAPPPAKKWLPVLLLVAVVAIGASLGSGMAVYLTMRDGTSAIPMPAQEVVVSEPTEQPTPPSPDQTLADDASAAPQPEPADGIPVTASADTPETPPVVEVPTEPEIVTVTMTADGLDQVLKGLPLTIIETKYVVQKSDNKWLYPDLLQAILKNNTNFDIKNAVIAFAAWDKNDLPVKIKGNMSINAPEYIYQVSCNEVNMIPGAVYGKGNGASIDESLKISRFVAVVVSYESFEGGSWENPFYNDWIKLYEGKKYSSGLTVEVDSNKLVPLATPEGARS